jgi:hypothetical protein
MYVSMHYGLPCRWPVIHPDIQAIRPVFLNQHSPDLADHFPNRGQCCWLEFKQAGNMLPGDHQGMALGNGESISDCQRVFRLMPYQTTFGFTEWAIGIHGISSPE